MVWEEVIENRLSKLIDAGKYRDYVSIDRGDGRFPNSKLNKDGSSVEANIWCSNDYLGLSMDPAVRNAVSQDVVNSGFGSGGARSISGNWVEHSTLEKELADFHERESALLFSTGFTANDASISTIGSAFQNTIIFSDELNHASLVKGIRGSKANKKIFKHNDARDLARLLEESPRDAQKVVVFESIYSMDGDFAPIEDILDVSKKYDCLTYLDEIHAIGIYGEGGRGVAAERGVADGVDILQAGFGKGLGGFGGYISASQPIVDLIKTLAPPYVFSTSMPGCIAAGNRAALHIVEGDNSRRVHLLELSTYIRDELTNHNIPVMSSHGHILPILVGNPNLNKAISARLLNEFRLYVQPVNSPTVLEGTERLRVTPTALHDYDAANYLIESMITVWNGM